MRVEEDGHSYFATLEIENVTVEDAGKYKVMAKNELGESNATISLNFDSMYIIWKTIASSDRFRFNWLAAREVQALVSVTLRS